MTSANSSVEDQLWHYVTSKHKSPDQTKQLYSILALNVLANVIITPAVLKKVQTFERWFDMISLPRFRILGKIFQQKNFHLSSASASTSASASASASTSRTVTISQFPWFRKATTIQEMVNNLRNSMSKSRTLANVLQSDEAKRIIGEAHVKVQAALELQGTGTGTGAGTDTSTGTGTSSIKKKKKKRKKLPRITYDRRDEFSYRGSHYDLDSDIEIEDELEVFDDNQSDTHDYGCDDDYETTSTEEEPKSKNEDAVATESSSSDNDNTSVEVDIESSDEDEESHVQVKDQVQVQVQVGSEGSETLVEDDVASIDSWDIVSDDHSIISIDDDAEVPFSYKDAILMKKKEADQDTSRIKANFDTNTSKPLTQVVVVSNEDHILSKVECNGQEEQNLFDPDFFREKYSRGQKKKGRMRKNRMKSKS